MSTARWVHKSILAILSNLKSKNRRGGVEVVLQFGMTMQIHVAVGGGGGLMVFERV